MEKSSYYLEMYPDEISGSIPQELPALATDDPLFAFAPPGSSADATCRQLLDDSFAADIAGLSSSEFREKVSQTPKPQEFRKAVTPPVPTDDLAIDLGVMLKRAEFATAAAPRHRLAVEKMLSKMRSKLKKFEGSRVSDFDAIYARIATSMTDCVRRAIIVG